MFVQLQLQQYKSQVHVRVAGGRFFYGKKGADMAAGVAVAPPSSAFTLYKGKLHTEKRKMVRAAERRMREKNYK